ncbi:pro-neuregulin-2, membrane-bound isoform [Eurytemora carolleeae]|uniref:pro-neuregulin-2, membrane-bound isoform n=1 Tax=Eurytemora carolleeae TaxID=1294199 RepID=UPI000C76332B|nr:pro-neuregulin-2, membrane-bound isoform [Eurytemora carolleeae]|eukprot:XP_023322014.1 pro-neuregulin-2, membrane-bound isoform-like [Eurytemora affinis]
MRLTCSARGNPPPTLYWTMNGELIKHSQQSRIKTKKISKYLRKSVLKLEGPIDSSIHVQCHAYNSYGHASRVKLKTTSTTPRPQEVVRPRLSSHSQFRSTSAISSTKGLKNPLFSTGCPVENYCMNGGSCLYYSDIGELACHCSRGFHGRRCERKYVSGIIKGVKTTSHMPICIKGMGHYPCS